MRLTFKISMLSDYHISAGYGSGGVDSILLKDRDGYPLIKGTTLSGLLRQGMWELLQLDLLKDYRKCIKSGLDSGRSYCLNQGNDTICPICSIMGNPAKRGQWYISSARSQHYFTPGMNNVVWRNRIDPITRKAEERKLFNAEVAGASTELTFTVENEACGDEQLEEAAFIVAAFRMVRHLGSSRRRGKGECSIHLDNEKSSLYSCGDKIAEEKLLDLFDKKWLKKEVGRGIEYNSKSSKVPQHSTFSKKSNSSKKSFRVIVYAKEPLIFSNKGESGNQFRTTSYIPGTTFLGALAWRAAHRNNLEDPLDYQQFISFFRRGGIQVSPLYPAYHVGRNIYSTIPWPLDFLTCRLRPATEEHGHDVRGFAVCKQETNFCKQCLCEGFQTPMESLSQFIPLRPQRSRCDDTELQEAHDVSLESITHIAIDNKSGKVATGALFNYTTIQPSQYFIGTIDVDNWEIFSHFLGINAGKTIEDIRLGKASTRGYGGVNIWLLDSEDTQCTFYNISLRERVKDFNKPVTMTLLTDTIIMDPWGRFYGTLNKEVLEDLLNCQVEVINTYVRHKSIHGFQSYLGLPKWGEYALTAGSSVGFYIKGKAPEDILNRMEQIEREGIGFKKEEGFGMVAFNHCVYSDDVDKSVEIFLTDEMDCSSEKDYEIIFEQEWEECLSENIASDDYKQPIWRAVAIWLRANAAMPLSEIQQGLNALWQDSPLNKMIDQSQALREKKCFTDKDDENKIKKLVDVLNSLSEQSVDKDGTTGKACKIKGVEMLADYIMRSREGKSHDK